LYTGSPELLKETTRWTDEEIEKYISKFLGDINVQKTG
ncbi:unnamed protein product, partial [marine sediment metagenome]